MPDLDEAKLAKLAYEMALNIRNYKTIFADYGIDETEYYAIEKIPFYQRAKEQFTLEWNAITSTTERVKVLSAAATEQLLPIITSRAMNNEEPFPGVIKTVELTSRLAGIDRSNAEQPVNPADRFVITINLGADTDGKPVVEHYNKSIEATPNDLEVTTAETDLAEARVLAKLADVKEES
jgi:hypothetical protein